MDNESKKDELLKDERKEKMSKKSYRISKYIEANDTRHISIFNSQERMILHNKYTLDNIRLSSNRYYIDEKGRDIKSVSIKYDDNYKNGANVTQCITNYNDHGDISEFTFINNDEINTNMSYTTEYNYANGTAVETHLNGESKTYMISNDYTTDELIYSTTNDSSVFGNVEYVTISGKRLPVFKKTDKDETRYEYNSNGDLTKHTYKDLKDNLISVTLYGKDDKNGTTTQTTLRNISTGSLIGESSAHYDEYGNLLESEEVSYKKNRRYKITNTFDENNKVLTSKSVTDDNITTLTFIDYNKLGNILSRCVFSYDLSDFDAKEALNKQDSYINTYYKDNILVSTNRLDGKVTYKLLGLIFIDLTDEELEDYINTIDSLLIL